MSENDDITELGPEHRGRFRVRTVRSTHEWDLTADQILWRRLPGEGAADLCHPIPSQVTVAQPNGSGQVSFPGLQTR